MDTAPQPGQTSGAIFTVTEAAQACRVDRRTITRKMDALEAAGAYKDAVGQWRIPLAALLTAGFTPGKPAGPDATPSTPGHNNTPQGDALADALAENTRLHAELIDAQHRAQIAETRRIAAVAIADERSRHIDSLRTALRALEAAPPIAPQPQNGETPVLLSKPAHPRRWWRGFTRT